VAPSRPGALLYLAEHGLRFGAVAGSSIGSLNGAYLVQGDGSPGHLEGLCGV
jgi:predicted acylesterase/phospholipase RssA